MCRVFRFLSLLASFMWLFITHVQIEDGHVLPQQLFASFIVIMLWFGLVPCSCIVATNDSFHFDRDPRTCSQRPVCSPTPPKKTKKQWFYHKCTLVYDGGLHFFAFGAFRRPCYFLHLFVTLLRIVRVFCFKSPHFYVLEHSQRSYY